MCNPPLAPLPANHRAETDRDSLADPIALQPVKKNLDEFRPQPVQEDGADTNTRFFDQHFGNLRSIRPAAPGRRPVPRRCVSETALAEPGRSVQAAILRTCNLCDNGAGTRR